MSVRLLALFPVPAAGFWSDAGGRMLSGVRPSLGAVGLLEGAVGEGQTVSVSWRRRRGRWAEGLGLLGAVGVMGGGQRPLPVRAQTRHRRFSAAVPHYSWAAPRLHVGCHHV